MRTSTPNQLSGRDHHLIGRALYVAARALRAQEHPPHSDIEGMNELLDKHYPRVKEMYDWQTNLELAFRLGYQPKTGQLDNEDVERWIADHIPDENSSVVGLHERHKGRDPENWQESES